MNKRKEKRDKAASDLTRELRYQIANNCRDDNRLVYFLTKYMNVTGKEKYIRPKSKIAEVYTLLKSNPPDQ